MTDIRSAGSSQEGLRRRYGDRVGLLSEDGEERVYRLAAELAVGGRRYAVLQTEELERDDEIEVFRIVAAPDGEEQLESVADEDEWEQVAEAFDDLQFGSDEQP
ncbi:DUF1292 domain-containing protein [Cohnella hongkongensis]|uniref:DUF1292 domain-containing protein n=1 Tax=Cohnella hongkongensis TaxID=178337 RepID=A0ABV9FDW2_9BACL